MSAPHDFDLAQPIDDKPLKLAKNPGTPEYNEKLGQERAEPFDQPLHLVARYALSSDPGS